MAREGSQGRVYLAVNWNDRAQTVALPAQMTDLLASATVTTVTLPRYGIAVVTPLRKDR